MRGIWDNLRHLFNNKNMEALPNNQFKNSPRKNNIEVDAFLKDNSNESKYTTNSDIKSQKLESFDKIMCNIDNSTILPKIAEFGKNFTQYVKKTIDSNMLSNNGENLNDNSEARIPTQSYRTELPYDTEFKGNSRKRRIFNDENTQKNKVLEDFDPDENPNVFDVNDISLRQANTAYNRKIEKIITQKGVMDKKIQEYCPTNFSATSQHELFNFGKKRPKGSFGLPSAYVALYEDKNNDKNNYPVSYETVRHLQRRYKIDSIFKSGIESSLTNKVCNGNRVGKTIPHKKKNNNSKGTHKCHSNRRHSKRHHNNGESLCSKCSRIILKSIGSDALKISPEIRVNEIPVKNTLGEEEFKKTELLDYSLQAGDSLLEPPNNSINYSKGLKNIVTSSGTSTETGTKQFNGTKECVSNIFSNGSTENTNLSTITVDNNNLNIQSHRNIIPNNESNNVQQLHKHNEISNTQFGLNAMDVTHPKSDIKMVKSLINDNVIHGIPEITVTGLKNNTVNCENSDTVFNKLMVPSISETTAQNKAGSNNELLDKTCQVNTNADMIGYKFNGDVCNEIPLTNSNNVGGLLLASNENPYHFNGINNDKHNNTESGNLLTNLQSNFNGSVSSIRQANEMKNITDSAQELKPLQTIFTYEKKDNIASELTSNFANLKDPPCLVGADTQINSQKSLNAVNDKDITLRSTTNDPEIGKNQTLSHDNSSNTIFQTKSAKPNMLHNEYNFDDSKSKPIGFGSSFSNTNNLMLAQKKDDAGGMIGKSSSESLSCGYNLFEKPSLGFGSALGSTTNSPVPLSKNFTGGTADLTKTGFGISSTVPTTSSIDAPRFRSNPLQNNLREITETPTNTFNSSNIPSFGKKSPTTNNNVNTQNNGLSKFSVSNGSNNQTTTNLTQKSGFNFNVDNNNTHSSLGLSNNQGCGFTSNSKVVTGFEAPRDNIQLQAKPFSFQPLNPNPSINFNFSSAIPTTTENTGTSMVRSESTGTLGFSFSNTNQPIIDPPVTAGATFTSSSDSNGTPAMAFMRRRALRQKRQR